VYAGVKLEPSVTSFVMSVSDNGQKEKAARIENAVIVQNGLNEIANSLKQAASAGKGDAGKASGRAPSSQGSPPASPATPNAPLVIPSGEPVQPPLLSLQSGNLGAWPFALAVLLAGGIVLIALL